MNGVNFCEVNNDILYRDSEFEFLKCVIDAENINTNEIDVIVKIINSIPTVKEFPIKSDYESEILYLKDLLISLKKNYSKNFYFNNLLRSVASRLSIDYVDISEELNKLDLSPDYQCTSSVSCSYWGNCGLFEWIGSYRLRRKIIKLIEKYILGCKLLRENNMIIYDSVLGRLNLDIYALGSYISGAYVRVKDIYGNIICQSPDERTNVYGYINCNLSKSHRILFVEAIGGRSTFNNTKNRLLQAIKLVKYNEDSSNVVVSIFTDIFARAVKSRKNYDISDLNINKIKNRLEKNLGISNIDENYVDIRTGNRTFIKKINKIKSIIESIDIITYSDNTIDNMVQYLLKKDNSIDSSDFVNGFVNTYYDAFARKQDMIELNNIFSSYINEIDESISDEEIFKTVSSLELYAIHASYHIRNRTKTIENIAEEINATIETTKEQIDINFNPNASNSFEF